MRDDFASEGTDLSEDAVGEIHPLFRGAPTLTRR